MTEMDADDSRLSDLRGSARGWHGAQLAALGFIGLCGVLQRGGTNGVPRFLQVVAGVLVAGVAWPLDTGVERAGSDLLGRAGRRLRVGVATTFVAVGAVALAATSSWWPHTSAPAGLVEVTTASGVLCGSLDDGGQTALGLTVAGRQVVVALSDVVRLRPVESCG